MVASSVGCQDLRWASAPRFFKMRKPCEGMPMKGSDLAASGHAEHHTTQGWSAQQRLRRAAAEESICKRCDDDNGDAKDVPVSGMLWFGGRKGILPMCARSRTPGTPTVGGDIKEGYSFIRASNVTFW